MARPALSPRAAIRLPWPRFGKPLCDPGRRDFPSPVLTQAIPAPPSPRVRSAPADPEHAPDSDGWPRGSSPLRARSPQLGVWGRPRDRPVPRAPSPAPGVTGRRRGVAAPSAGVTPPSSLLRTHAPVPPPPAAFLYTVGGSLPVAVSPGWGRHLPDVISADLSTDAWTPTPAVPRVHLLVSSPEASAFPPFGTGRQPTRSRTATSVRGFLSGLWSFAWYVASGLRVCSPSRSLPPRGPEASRAARALTSGHTPGSLPAPGPDLLTV